MPVPFGKIEYLYMGTANFDRDIAYYREVIGAELVWNLEGFGAHVAAFRIGEGPMLLIADHRPAKTIIPLWAVANLKETSKRLKKRGWKPDGGVFEIPPGSCSVFEDPSGNRLGLFQNDRPHPFE